MSHKSLALALGLLLPLPGLLAQTTTPPQPPAALAQAAQQLGKPALTHADYAQWRSIQGTQLSRDGQWLAYALVGQESDGELVLRRLADGQEWRTPRGTAPAFSADGRFVAFQIQPTRAELDKAKKDKKKPDELPKPGVGWMDLSTGKVESVARAKRFAWGEEGGQTLAVLLEAAPAAKPASPGAAAAAKGDLDAEVSELDQEMQPGEGAAGAAGGGKKSPGTELLLIQPGQAQRHSLKDVADFQWSRPGDRLAYIVSVKDTPKPAAKPEAPKDNTAETKPDAKADTKGDESAREGVYLLNPAQPDQPQTLLAGKGHYKQLRFDREGQQLAFVSNRDHVAVQAQAAKAKPKNEDKPADKAAEDKAEPTPFKLFYWRAGQAVAEPLVSADTAGMPSGWSPSEFAALSFSRDGQRLFLGTAKLPAAEPKDAPEPMKVDLWHWKDPKLQSVQKVEAEREKQRSYRAVVHLAQGDTPARLVQLATPEMPTVQVNDNPRWALGLSDLPYQPLMSWDGVYMDSYVVDLQTGQAKPLAKKSRHAPRLSPTGRYVLGFDALKARWLAWESASAQPQALDLTGKIKARFDNIERDVPDLPSPYGVAGWTAQDDSVLLYDQYDLWAVNPATGTHRNLTQGEGRKAKLEFRVELLDKEDADAKPLPADRLLLAATHEIQRDSGYFQLDLNGGQGAKPKQLILAPKMVGGLIKAKNADRVVFTQQSFTEFPDLWSDASPALAAPQKISAANPQQARYNWGTQELIEYRAANGKTLRALLAKPENFDPKKKYPMMVYIYENMTDNRYRHVPPAPGQNINVTRYVSNGYLVLRPDITYTTGHPGKSAMGTVLPAIQQVVKQGYVDAKRIGIQGHSWGAYQINYLITQTKLFAAAEAGASMANMVSGYGGIRWGTGLSRAFQYEHGQSRMGTTPWERPDLYLENSPIFHIHKVSTPYLTIHNDDDDAVPWYQGIEMFTALRRLGKEAYWFNYNGAKHGLRDREQMKHFTVHMAEFFDHFLLGQPRAEWMDKPVPYLERGKRDVTPLFKPATTPATTPASTSAKEPVKP
jgi:dipeptidyl aminopeptidase/acylaminoacyl peptidase